jgi:hypothetical protein
MSTTIHLRKNRYSVTEDRPFAIDSPETRAKPTAQTLAVQSSRSKPTEEGT